MYSILYIIIFKALYTKHYLQNRMHQGNKSNPESDHVDDQIQHVHAHFTRASQRMRQENKSNPELDPRPDNIGQIEHVHAHFTRASQRTNDSIHINVSDMSEGRW